jgi:dihydrofolate reductase
MERPVISIIAALGRHRELGMKNELLWRIPDDLKRFKTLTMGHAIIMGGNTFLSIGKPLPGRTNIVATRVPLPHHEGAIVVSSMEDAITEAKAVEEEEIFVIGGAQIYAAALPFADVLHLTLIDDEKEGDVFFPPYEDQFTKKTSEESGEWNGLKYRWVDLERE